MSKRIKLTPEVRQEIATRHGVPEADMTFEDDGHHVYVETKIGRYHYGFDRDGLLSLELYSRGHRDDDANGHRDHQYASA